MANEELIVITCAAGRQNSFLLPHLATQPNYKLRLIVHSDPSRAALSSRYPAAEVVSADLSDPSSVRALLHNATILYHVGPPFHPYETQIGYHAIDAAIAESKRPGTRFKHFIYSSVLNTQIRKLLNHDCKRYVEEYLIESGLNYTILQPTHFMDNLPLQLMLEKGLYPAPYSADVKFSFLALRDLAEIAAKVIREGEKHYLAQYPLCSTGPVSYRERIELFDRMFAKQTKVVEVPYGEACQTFGKRLFGEDVDRKRMDGVQRLLLYYDNYGLKGNTTVCEWLLGRKPETLEQWYKVEMEKLSAK